MIISVIILTKNEELNIRDCLETVKWADEIIIADSLSRDETINISRQYTDRILVDSFAEPSFTEKRRTALNAAKNKWVLFLDADERLTPELQNEIIELNDNNDIDGYFINRRNHYFNKWIKCCHQYPDYILRLVRKESASVTERKVHEGLKVNGRTLKLQNDMIHLSYKDMNQIVKKSNLYSTLQAQEYFEQCRKSSKLGTVIKAFSALLRVFISRKGYKEGIYGYYVSFTNSFITLLTYLKLLKMQNRIS